MFTVVFSIFCIPADDDYSVFVSFPFCTYLRRTTRDKVVAMTRIRRDASKTEKRHINKRKE